MPLLVFIIITQNSITLINTHGMLLSFWRQHWFMLCGLNKEHLFYAESSKGERLK